MEDSADPPSVDGVVALLEADAADEARSRLAALRSRAATDSPCCR